MPLSKQEQEIAERRRQALSAYEKQQEERELAEALEEFDDRPSSWYADKPDNQRH